MVGSSNSRVLLQRNEKDYLTDSGIVCMYALHNNFCRTLIKCYQKIQ